MVEAPKITTHYFTPQSRYLFHSFVSITQFWISLATSARLIGLSLQLDRLGLSIRFQGGKYCTSGGGPGHENDTPKGPPAVTQQQSRS